MTMGIPQGPQIDAVGNVTEQQKKKRFGVFPVKIGTSLMHRLGIDQPIEAPIYDARPAPTATRSRTSVRRGPEKYEMGTLTQNGQSFKFPSKAKAGSLVSLDVQPYDGLEPREQKLCKWRCTHPDCAAMTHASKKALIEHHLPRGVTNALLQKEAEREIPARAFPHMFYGFLEIEGDEKTGELPVIMLVSDEE